jgi:hypothetical protein
MRRSVCSLTIVSLLAACGCGRASSRPTDDADVAGAGGVGSEVTLGAPGLSEPIAAEPTRREPSPDDGQSAFPCRRTHEPTAQLVHACVLLSACAPEWLSHGGSTVDYRPVPMTLSECIGYGVPGAEFPSACSNAETCAEMGRCFGAGFWEETCPLDPFGGSFCQGSKLINCGELYPAQYVDCARLGATCVELDDENEPGADCVVDAPCLAADDGAYRCDGSKRVKCLAGLARGEDCAAAGADCVDGEAGATCQKIAGCTPEPAACSADDSATFCEDNGVEYRLDCRVAGLSCSSSEDEIGFTCRAPGCSMEEAALCYEECDGPIARLCVGGSRLSVDCREHDFDYCHLDLGLDGPIARCSGPVIRLPF